LTLPTAPPTASTREEIELLIQVLPPPLQAAIRQSEDLEHLVEIVIDLGRSPEVRTFNGRTVFEDIEVQERDIEDIVARIGLFGDDNRAGIARTLHRISAIRNRSGRIIGLTLRAGRAVYGTAEIVRDVIESGKSVLLVGRPGVGKTTMLRETARLLAEHKRVVIVDTSNEIAGDGDIPHAAIGRARRMQVPTPSQQHEVMIEAVENHNPEVIVIDEIGRELEAQAARTIAERGVQLIGTAHGNTLENLTMNPTLSDLVGGIESVTLSDEEARRRGTQKSVLERRAPPTFDVAIEIQDWQRLALHHDVGRAMDALLRERPLAPEIRYVGEDEQVHIEPGTPLAPAMRATPSPPRRTQPRADGHPGAIQAIEIEDDLATEPVVATRGLRPRRVFAYGVSQSRLRRSARALGIPAQIVDELADAEALITLKSYYRKRPVVISDAEERRIPIFVLRSNTYAQIEGALADLFEVPALEDPQENALRETREAINAILSGARTAIELPPRDAEVRRRQHDLARSANLLSLSRGKEPHRRVRIFRADV